MDDPTPAQDSSLGLVPEERVAFVIWAGHTLSYLEEKQDHNGLDDYIIDTKDADELIKHGPDGGKATKATVELKDAVQRKFLG